MRPTGVARGRRRRAGRGLALALGASLLAPGLAAIGAEPAPAPSPVKVIHHNGRAFRIPFNIDPDERSRIKEVLLCVSEDRGQTWKKVVSRSSTADKRALAYRAPQDGEYWFAVQTLDNEGRLYPPKTAEIEPKMKVIVDTVPPTVRLEPAGRRGSFATVRWEVRDDRAIDRGAFALEFQAVGASDWRKIPVPTPADATGKASWDAGTAGPVRVRLQAADLAQNVQDATIVLPDGTAEAPGEARGPMASTAPADREPAPLGTFASAEVEGLPQFPTASGSPASSPGPGPKPPASSPSESATAPANPFDVPARGDDGPGASAPAEGGAGAGSASGTRPSLVPSPRFNLEYEVADAGPNGPASVELWVTQNQGRTWSPLAQDPDRRSPFPVVLGGEGVFGLKLVARSASKLGDAPPEPGEPPETLVEVDSTPPSVKLDRVQVVPGPGEARIALTWHASDLHLGARPVMILVRAEGSSEWRPAGPPIENNGRYLWTVPSDAPPRFYVRVQVADRVGNAGSDETPEGSPVNVDRTRPRGRITRIVTGGTE